jgi:hypothetical protein
MPAGLPLENITHHHTPSLAHLLALLLHPRVDTFPAETALVVVDSASTVFTAAFPPGMEVRGSRKSKLASARRFPIMATLVTELGRLAAVRNCVVLVCQQMNTRIVTGYGGVLQPAVGMAGWGNGLSTRLLVYRRDDKGEGKKRRWVRVVKAAGRSWEESGPRVCVRIGEKWEDLELPEEEGREPDLNTEARTDEEATTPPPELIAPHAPEPPQQPSLKVQPPTSTGKRKRSTKVIPDSDGEEDEGLSDDENLAFGWGDDGLFDLGEKGAMDNRIEDRIENVEAPPEGQFEAVTEHQGVDEGAGLCIPDSQEME